jgi:hypothetical protein
MRIFLVLICSLALALAASGAQEQKKEKKPAPKKAAAPAAHVSQPKGKAVGRSAETGKAAGAGKPTGVGKSTGAGGQVGVGKHAGKGKGKQPGAGSGEAYYKAPGGAKGGATGKPAKVGKATGAGKPAHATTATTAGKFTATGKPFKAQHYNLPTKTRPTKVAAVNFQQGRHIQGSQNWQGSRYTVFRNYSSQWHDRNWWSGHYNRVIFVYGGWYAWNAGYWIPAWGYAPNAYYAYDGPIYGYNGLPPDQVIANAQAALQQQGYYRGQVDGLLGPLTRAAVADYQRDHGLYITSAIDRPTLSSLGLV